MDIIEGIYGENRNLADQANQDGSGIETAMQVLEHLNAEQSNLQSLCRTCLVVKSGMHSLVRSQDNEELPNIFTSFTDIQLDLDECLPLLICEPCKLQLLSSYEFRLKCLSSDHTLKMFLKPMSVCIKAEAPHIIKNPATSADDLIGTKIEDDPISNNYGIKSEPYAVNQDFHEDVQYLEDLSDSDHENTMYIVQEPTVHNPVLLITTNLGTVEKQSNEKENTKGKACWPKNTCELCGKKFKNAVALKGHRKRIHSGQDPSYPFSCDQCRDSFESERDLWLHSALHAGDGNIWKCNQCPKEFGRRTALRRHIRRHMEIKRHVCPYCGKQFAEHYALQRHSRVHTGLRPEKKYHCHLCDKRYSEKNLLTTHLARHEGLKPCVCAVCGKRFATTRLLNSHSLTHSEKKPFKCDFCDKRFRHEQSRITHHRTHTGERPYICAVCGKCFIQACNLSLHMRSHTGEKPYTCPTCQSSFSSGSTLKAHIRVHTGERPYTCHHCGKRFSRSGLHHHCRMHTVFRRHACALCKRRFASAARLRDHHRVHTGEKPYECDDCQMKFTTKGQLVKHLKTHANSSKRKRSRKQRQSSYDNLIIFNDDAANMPLSDYTDKEQFNNYIPSRSMVPELPNKQDYPIDVSGELVLDDSEMKTDLLVVDEPNYQNEALCLNNSINSINYINNDVNYTNEMPTNLVTLNEEGMSISSSSMMEGATMKLYQLDQSLVQIHSSAGQFTISKITSKTTAHF